MLVDLDSILDTRLGTIAKFGPEAHARVMYSGYFNRVSDHFVDIDPDRFFELYQKRDVTTLAASMVTQVASIVNDFVRRVNISYLNSPIRPIPCIDINIYPYVIPDEICTKIAKALAVLITGQANVGYVSYSPKDLYYDLVKFNYDHLVMYDPSEWLSAHAEDWEKRMKGLADVTLIFPILHRAKKKEDVPENVFEQIDDICRTLTPVINLMPVPSQFFCIALDPVTILSSSEAIAPEEESGKVQATGL